MLKVLLCMGILSSTVLAQGFGGGGFGGGFGGDGFGGQPLDQNVIQTTDCIVVVAKSREFVTAFSTKTGKATKVTFETVPDQIIPIVGASVACFVVGDEAYGFAGDTGKWLKTKIEGDGPYTPVVSGNSVQVWTDKAIYVCSAASQRWQIMER